MNWFVWFLSHCTIKMGCLILSLNRLYFILIVHEKIKYSTQSAGFINHYILLRYTTIQTCAILWTLITVTQCSYSFVFHSSKRHVETLISKALYSAQHYAFSCTHWLALRKGLIYVTIRLMTVQGRINNWRRVAVLQACNNITFLAVIK